MLKHKSFVLNCGKKPKANIKPMAKSYAAVMEPQIASSERDDDTSHYDDNEAISLVLPHSLSDADDDTDDSYEDDSDERNNTYNSQSQSYHSDDDEDDDYSDANAYFEESQSFSNQNHSNVNNKESEIESKKQDEYDSNNEDDDDETIETHEAVVMDSDEDDDDSSTVEQDKKFEEDIKAILTGKKQFDNARNQDIPEEANKAKNHGLMDKNGKNVEDKLKNDHAIFDKIAQSMEMASSYDLGSIAMDKKFDLLEKETDTDFNKKIHDLIEKDKHENPQPDESEAIDDVLDSKKNVNLEQSETSDIDVLKKAMETIEDEDDHVETKDFLNDLDKLKAIEMANKSDITDKLSKQSSFNTTISIGKGSLKSRVFEVSGNTVEVMLDSYWNPSKCSELKELNVTLTKSVDYWADSEQGTKNFRIGGPDTKTWNDLEPGNYYLTFYYDDSLIPNCELQGALEVKA